MRHTRILGIAAALLFVTGLAFAANGDTLNIGGQVPLVLTLTVTADAAADNLTLTTGGANTGVTAAIATIDVTTNNSAGWELWVFSSNADATDTGMINADGNEIGYTISYAGAGGSLTPANITSSGLMVGEDTSNSTQSGQALSVTYTQSASHPAGYYSDQLSIVLRAK